MTANGSLTGNLLIKAVSGMQRAHSRLYKVGVNQH
jgi:hypothetical protein